MWNFGKTEPQPGSGRHRNEAVEIDNCRIGPTDDLPAANTQTYKITAVKIIQDVLRELELG